MGAVEERLIDKAFHHKLGRREFLLPVVHVNHNYLIVADQKQSNGVLL
jgi:hypothetical protein